VPTVTLRGPGREDVELKFGASRLQLQGLTPMTQWTHAARPATIPAVEAKRHLCDHLEDSPQQEHTTRDCDQVNSKK